MSPPNAPSLAEIQKICPGYTLEPITDHRGYQRCVDLQLQVWEYADRADVVPTALLAISEVNGGILLGAYDGRHRMVGFVYSLAGLHHGHVVQHSHMLGVLPAHRNRNLGLALKLAQRTWSLQLGVDEIVWTYDPLQRLNAHFNFNLLGVEVDIYEVNIYGRSTSALHRGLDTDRFLARWRLNAPLVRQKLKLALLGKGYTPPCPTLPVVNVLKTLPSGLQVPAGKTRESRARRFLFQIPDDINRLKSERLAAAVRAQRQLREVCLRSFGRGYRVSGFFTRTGPRECYYLFEKR